MIVVYLIARHMEGGYRHEHIAQVRWRNPADGASDVSTREEMVRWIVAGNQAFVADGQRQIGVRVVRAMPPYIQTYAAGIWTDNLLALPTF